eukprot:709342-Pleurochrysis_carterae.AAC.2
MFVCIVKTKVITMHAQKKRSSASDSMHPVWYAQPTTQSKTKCCCQWQCYRVAWTVESKTSL